MRPPLDQDQQNAPWRVLLYLSGKEYDLEYGRVEISDRWYTPGRQFVESVLWL